MRRGRKEGREGGKNGGRITIRKSTYENLEAERTWLVRENGQGGKKGIATANPYKALTGLRCLLGTLCLSAPPGLCLPLEEALSLPRSA